jgi:uncharacterized protein YeaO (DUF488 family)
MIRTKSVHSDIEPGQDGLRVLVARFRGRGLSKESYDVWMPNLGPSERLLRSVQSGDVTWAQFSSLYKRELFEDGPIDSRNPTIKNHGQKFTLRLLQHLARTRPVTLLCHCAEDASQCHRFLLQKMLERATL